MQDMTEQVTIYPLTASLQSHVPLSSLLRLLEYFDQLAANSSRSTSYRYRGHFSASNAVCCVGIRDCNIRKKSLRTSLEKWLSLGLADIYFITWITEFLQRPSSSCSTPLIDCPWPFTACVVPCTATVTCIEPESADC